MIEALQALLTIGFSALLILLLIPLWPFGIGTFIEWHVGAPLRTPVLA